MLPISNWDSEYREDALQIYDFAPSSSYMDHCTFLAPRLVRTFALPLSRKDLRDISLSAHVAGLDIPSLYDRRRDSAASASSGSSTGATCGQLPLAKKPFYDSGITRLCSLVLSSHGKNGCAYLFLVHARTLLSSWFNGYFDASPDEPIPWSVWGAQNAACLYGQHFAQHDLWDAHGDRVAILEPDWPHTSHIAATDGATCIGKATRDGTSSSSRLPQPTMWRLVVLDFNQDRIRRFLTKESWPMDDTSPTARRNVRPPRVMQSAQCVRECMNENFGAAYEEPIAANLPYIETVYPKKIVGSRRPRISIDGEHIVLNYVSIFLPLAVRSLNAKFMSSKGLAAWGQHRCSHILGI